MWHFDTAFGFLSTSMRMWTQPMNINTGLIQVHRYFCNATSCASPHWELNR